MKLKYTIAVLFMSFLISVSKAQPGGGDPNGGGKPVPMTGIELLLIAGGLFGAKKAFKKK